MNPDGSLLIDRADENTFNDIRCQIAQQRLIGYTYAFEGNVGTINEKGECSQWFSGMFDLEEIFITKLFILSRDTNVDTKHLDDKIDKSVLKLNFRFTRSEKDFLNKYFRDVNNKPRIQDVRNGFELYEYERLLNMGVCVRWNDSDRIKLSDEYLKYLNQ